MPSTKDGSRSLTLVGHLWDMLHRHVGHRLVCAHESCKVGGFKVDTVSLRCDDCGEILIAADADVTHAPRRTMR